MDEYISREGILKEIEEEIEHGDEFDKEDKLINKGLKIAIKDIKRLPSADVQPVKHGRWILSDDKYWLKCSFCGAYFDVSCGAPFFYVDNEEVSHINFCPNCGARMGGDSE